MPYIETDKVKEIRQRIKKEFKDYKFSVKKQNHSVVDITLLQSPIDLEDGSVNPFYIDKNFENEPLAKHLFNRLVQICHEVKPMKIINADSDYGDWPNYYIDLSVGRWDKPYIKTPDKDTKPDLLELKFNRYDSGLVRAYFNAIHGKQKLYCLTCDFANRPIVQLCSKDGEPCNETEYKEIYFTGFDAVRWSMDDMKSAFEGVKSFCDFDEKLRLIVED